MPGFYHVHLIPNKITTTQRKTVKAQCYCPSHWYVLLYPVEQHCAAFRWGDQSGSGTLLASLRWPLFLERIALKIWHAQSLFKCWNFQAQDWRPHELCKETLVSWITLLIPFNYCMQPLSYFPGYRTMLFDEEVLSITIEVSINFYHDSPTISNLPYRFLPYVSTN